MSELPELSKEEKEAIAKIDMTPILGTVEERLRFAMDKAMQFMRERNLAWNENARQRDDYEARHATSLEVIRAREQEVERQRLEIDTLKRQLAIASKAARATGGEK
jgi:hypothetical protein